VRGGRRDLYARVDQSQPELIRVILREVAAATDRRSCNPHSAAAHCKILRPPRPKVRRSGGRALDDNAGEWRHRTCSLLDVAPVGPAEAASADLGFITAIVAASPALEVLLPVHNEAESIEGTIREIYGALSPQVALRFIICEDGSVDGTKKVVMRLAASLPPKLTMSEERKGSTLGGSVETMDTVEDAEANRLVDALTRLVVESP
jgi:hypothetical protein